ncbi:MAG: glycosyltransferase [Rickettsiales bacterium]|jgi:glycosyltransferase involved in cell wall biosynthesis|nr:glycosyltransferase [Rickettsiales bacterium]
MSLISVIIPMFNNGATIQSAIDSVISQTVQDFEIIVIDDASTDDSVSIINGIGDRRLRCIKLESHKNANVARNRGIDLSIGKYCAFLDADDEWMPNHLERMIEIIQKFNCDGAYGVPIFDNDASSPEYVFRKKHESMIDYLFRAPYCAQTSTLMLSAESARNVKFDETLLRHQDYDFLCRYDKKFKLCGDAVPTVIYHPTKKQFTPAMLDSCIRFIEKNKKDINNYSVAANYFRNMISLCKGNKKYTKYYEKMLRLFEKDLINIIEIDSRDTRYPSGIAKYFDVLDTVMPKTVNIFKIIFYYSPNIREVRITNSSDELRVFHPFGFPQNTLYGSIMGIIGARLRNMHNLIVKCNCIGCEGLALSIRTQVPCKMVGVLHCSPHRSLRTIMAQKANPAAPIFPPTNPFSAMDHIISVHNCGNEFLDGTHNNRPFSVIHNGIAVPAVKKIEKSDDAFRFIFPGGFAPHKGFANIIPAIRIVSEKYKIEIIVMGGGKIPKEAKDLPVIATGLLTDEIQIEKYYQNADAALFASISEACSFAGIEAMSYNLPIVSTDAMGLVEMFENAAIFVKMNDKAEINPTEYAAAMIKIIESAHLRTRLGILSYARFIKKYTAKRMVRKTLELYKKLNKA